MNHCAAPAPAAPPGEPAAAAPRRSHETLVAPTLLPNGIEYSVHTLPRAFRADLQPVLPGVPLDDAANATAAAAAAAAAATAAAPFLLVPTCQRAAVDLVRWDDEVAAEKDLLLERFVAWAAAVCDALAARGCWGDYVDPCSGLAVRTPHSRVPYPEVDAFETLLRWRTGVAGCCRVLSHPTWGTHAYLATLFARAPVGVLEECLREAAAAVPVKAAAAGAAAAAP